MKKRPFVKGRMQVSIQTCILNHFIEYVLYEEKAQQKIDSITNLVMKYCRDKAFVSWQVKLVLKVCLYSLAITLFNKM